MCLFLKCCHATEIQRSKIANLLKMQTRVLNILVVVFVLRCLLLSNAQTQNSDLQKLPDYIAPCYRDDPELAVCLKSTMYGAIRKLKHGIPELDIPPIEPLFKDEIEAFDVAGFRAKITNITFRGASTLKIVWNSASIKTKQYFFRGEIDSLEANADYGISGFFFYIPIRAAGTFTAIGRNVEFTVGVVFDAVPINGVDFIVIKDVRVKVNINDCSGWISNLGPFEEAINHLLNNRLNKRFIFNQMSPIIEEVVPQILEKFSNRLFANVPYDAVLLKGTGPVHNEDDDVSLG